MTDLLDNDLCAKIKSSKSHAAEDRATHEAGCRDVRVARKCPEDRCASYQAHYLRINKPEASAHRTDSPYQPRSEPCSQDLQDNRQSPGYAHLRSIVAS